MAYRRELSSPSARAQGLVVAIANAATEVGQISQSMAQRRVSLRTPLTRKFAKFSRTLLYAILTLATLNLRHWPGTGRVLAVYV
jgi:cation-transporting ATPase F